MALDDPFDMREWFEPQLLVAFRWWIGLLGNGADGPFSVAGVPLFCSHGTWIMEPCDFAPVVPIIIILVFPVFHTVGNQIQRHRRPDQFLQLDGDIFRTPEPLGAP